MSFLHEFLKRRSDYLREQEGNQVEKNAEADASAFSDEDFWVILQKWKQAKKEKPEVSASDLLAEILEDYSDEQVERFLHFFIRLNS